MPEDSLLEIGVIRKAHGIRGEVSVEYFAESPALLRGTVFLQCGSQPPYARAVRKSRFHQGRMVTLFADVDTRTAAEGLRGCRILVPKTALPPAGAHEVYLHDLLGMRVILEKTGQVLGTVAHVEGSAEQELWNIRTPDGREILLPAVPEFILGIDLETRSARVDPPPGLLDLYLS